MNCVLQLEEINRKSDFDNNVQRSQEEWEYAAEYAKFLVDFSQAPEKFENDQAINLKDFIA